MTQASNSESVHYTTNWDTFWRFATAKGPIEEEIMLGYAPGFAQLAIVGPLKPLGFLSEPMLQLWYRLTIEETERWAREQERSTHIVDRHFEGHRGLYVYDPRSVSRIIDENKAKILENEWPTDPDGFVKKVGECPSDELGHVISLMFGDRAAIPSQHWDAIVAESEKWLKRDHSHSTVETIAAAIDKASDVWVTTRIPTEFLYDQLVAAWKLAGYETSMRGKLQRISWTGQDEQYLPYVDLRIPGAENIALELRGERNISKKAKLIVQGRALARTMTSEVQAILKEFYCAENPFPHYADFYSRFIISGPVSDSYRYRNSTPTALRIEPYILIDRPTITNPDEDGVAVISPPWGSENDAAGDGLYRAYYHAAEFTDFLLRRVGPRRLGLPQLPPPQYGQPDPANFLYKYPNRPLTAATPLEEHRGLLAGNAGFHARPDFAYTERFPRRGIVAGRS